MGKPSKKPLVIQDKAVALREEFGLVEQREFYAFLGITFESGVNNRFAGKYPPVVKIGHAIFFRKADITKWLARHQVAA
jgi:hypothetical protein